MCAMLVKFVWKNCTFDTYFFIVIFTMLQTLIIAYPKNQMLKKPGIFVKLVMTCLCESAPPLCEQYFYSKPQGGKLLYPTQGRGGGGIGEEDCASTVVAGRYSPGGGWGRGGGVEPPVGGGTPSRE
jgi:hypothetical protein